jgi:hypothetical protein
MLNLSWMCTTVGEIMNRNWKCHFLKGHYSSKYHHWTMTKYKLDMCIPLTDPHVKFELNVYSCMEDIEWKLKYSYILQSSRGMSLSKIIKPWANLILNCTILYHIDKSIWGEFVKLFERKWTKTDNFLFFQSKWA